jgi:hypothetical protein
MSNACIGCYFMGSACDYCMYVFTVISALVCVLAQYDVFYVYIYR